MTRFGKPMPWCAERLPVASQAHNNAPLRLPDCNRSAAMESGPRTAALRAALARIGVTRRKRWSRRVKRRT